MAEQHDTVTQTSDLMLDAEEIQRQYAEEIAEIRRKYESGGIEAEPHPALQHLLDTQDEFRTRVTRNLRAALGI